MRLPATPRLHSSPIGVLPCLRRQTPDTSNAFNEILSLPEDSNGKIPHPTFPTDPGVENPSKNPYLLNSDGNTLKVDPAPLLSHRLRGCNIYFVGMMGCVKSRPWAMPSPKEWAPTTSYRYRDSVGQCARPCAMCCEHGGGMVLRNQNWSMLQTGLVVYLKVEPEVHESMDVAGAADVVIRALHDFIDENPPAWKMAKATAQADGIDWLS
ncbi:hypothetical protein HJC23_002964 [Cyclotella cryptica]|uniref:Uncharacterized protein n=1 Tax=Cyclotella cryptica TaxID=29204 RepID=A0ABD3PFC5_9STRA